MSNKTPSSKNDRRQAARETARRNLERSRKVQRRNRFFIQGGLAVGILAVLAVVVLVIVNMNGGSSAVTATSAGPKNMSTNGISFAGENGKVAAQATGAVQASSTPKPVSNTNADGTPKIVTYIDWTCPSCKQFEAAYSSKILDLVAQGKATLEIHPVAILDTHYGTTHFSTRAANAAACVANYDPQDFLAVQNQFYEHQPEEGTTGLTNSQILGLVRAGGVHDSKVTSCVTGEVYKSWVTASTNRAVGSPSLQDPASHSFGTPTILVNGKRWNQQSDLISVIKSS